MSKEDKIIQKDELKNLKAIEKTKEKRYVDYKWIIKIILITFVISLSLSFVSGVTLPSVPTIIGILLVLIFILIGVIFDMIGVSVTAADLSVFNSMSSRKVKGARLAVKFKKNADKVSSFCNDVIGDICGIISGGTGIAISNLLANSLSLNHLITTLIITAVIASLTIGGKALGKSVAINNSTKILYMFTRFLAVFTRS